VSGTIRSRACRPVGPAASNTSSHVVRSTPLVTRAISLAACSCPRPGRCAARTRENTNLHVLEHALPKRGHSCLLCTQRDARALVGARHRNGREPQRQIPTRQHAGGEPDERRDLLRGRRWIAGVIAVAKPALQQAVEEKDAAMFANEAKRVVAAIRGGTERLRAVAAR